jgi:hypothetical protein
LAALWHLPRRAAQLRIRRQATPPARPERRQPPKSIITMALKKPRKARSLQTRLQRQQQAHHPNKLVFIVTQAAFAAAFFSPSKKGFPFSASLLKMLRNNSLQS